ncbi:hypothetical protein FRX31_017252 [Thalictrum thalictroides]|uniref:Bifunctional inhibitor/plant lipid transfer protein/seed storage helical domain-containing protein n=1 Tax=Thalictrum thalictroides TaxID=46969 RepID=A0A7J6W987_THATH|nr:hypothetical protein FRX31_017252 [Thalictrum thalictroides]
MTGFAILGVLLMFVVALGEVSVYQTIITTAKFDCQSDKYCAEELSGRPFHSCSHYLQPDIQFIPEEARRLQEACCYELYEMKDPSCKWQALKKTAQRVGSGLDEEMAQEVITKAEQLWRMCRIWKLAAS